MIEQLTQRYVEAFAAKDLNAIASMMSDDFELTDPSVHVRGKKEALEVVRSIFDGNPRKFLFRATNIYVDRQTSIMEFVFEIEGATLKGADVIEWKGGSMTAVRAYVYQASS